MAAVLAVAQVVQALSSVVLAGLVATMARMPLPAAAAEAVRHRCCWRARVF